MQATPQRPDTPATVASTATDVGPLAWVLDELRKSLAVAAKSLRRFMREAEGAVGTDLSQLDASPLRMARQQLHQACGALEMVGQPMAARIVTSMESVVQKISQQPENCKPEWVQKFERASFALLEYLDSLVRERGADPVVLFSHYKELQELVGNDRTHPADLWPMTWRWVNPELGNPVAPISLSSHLRSDFDQAVLKIVKTGDVEAANELRHTCLGLAAGQTPGPIAAFWKVSAAYFEAIATGAIEPDVYVKRAASRVLQQYAQLARNELQISDRLAHDLLFFCAQAEVVDPAVCPVLTAVRQAFGLSDHVGVDYLHSPYGNVNPALLAQARKRIGAAKEAWEALNEGDDDRSRHVTELFGLVADSLIKLQPQGRALARALTQAVEHCLQTAQPPSAELAMEVATAMLYLEAEFEDWDAFDPEMPTRTLRLAERLDGVLRGERAKPLESWMADLYRRVSDRQTLGSVVGELRASLSELEAGLDQYVRDGQDARAVPKASAQLAQVQSVLSVLGLDQAVLAVSHMRQNLGQLSTGQMTPEQKTVLFDHLGNNLGVLGFQLDMLNYQPGLAKSLFVFDAQRNELKPVMGHTQPIPPERPDMTVAPALVTDVVLPANVFVDTTSLDVEPAPVVRSAPTQVDPGFAVTELGEEDLEKVFIDEAAEVLQAGQEAAVMLSRHPADLVQRTTLRRAFHTLKGSSRMVGLSAFGEAAWAMEQLHNASLAEQKAASEPLLQLSEQALSEMAQWIEDIAEHNAGSWSPQRFRTSADALRLEGRFLPLNDMVSALMPMLPAEPKPVTRPGAAVRVTPSKPLAVQPPAPPSFAPVSAPMPLHSPTTRSAPFDEIPPVPATEDTLDQATALAYFDIDVPTESPGPESLLPDDLTPDPVRTQALPFSSDREPVSHTLTVPEPGQASLNWRAGSAAAPRMPAPPLVHPPLSDDLVDFPLDDDASNGVPVHADPLDFNFEDLPDLSLHEAPPAPPPAAVTQPLPELPPLSDFDMAPVLSSGATFTQTPPPLAPQPLVELPSLALDATAPAAPPAPAPFGAAAVAPAPAPAPKIPPVAPAVVQFGAGMGVPALRPMQFAGAAMPYAFGGGYRPVQPAAVPAPAPAPVPTPAPVVPVAPVGEVVPAPAPVPEPEVAAPFTRLEPTPPSFSLPVELDSAPAPVLDGEGFASIDLSPLELAPASLDVPVPSVPTQPLPDLPALYETMAEPAGGAEPWTTSAVVDVFHDTSRDTPHGTLPEPAETAPMVETALTSDALPPAVAPAWDAVSPASAVPDSAAPGESHELTASLSDGSASPSGHDEQNKVVGDLRISIPLYNVYLNEADEWSRQLQTLMNEWQLEPNRSVPEHATNLAHSLAGSSSAVGFDALSGLSRLTEHALRHLEQSDSVPRDDIDALSLAADDIRRLLHQFAAGFIKEPSPDIESQLQMILATPVVSNTVIDGGFDSMPMPANTGAGRDTDTSLPIDFVHSLAEPLSADDEAARDAVPPAPVVRSPTSAPEADAAFAVSAAPVEIVAQVLPTLVAPAQIAAPVAATPAPAMPIDMVLDGDADIDDSDNIEPELFPIFDEEASELMPRLDNEMRRWAARPERQDARLGVLRVLHTLKGSARLAGAKRLGEMAHRMETLLGRLPQDGLTTEQLTPVLAHLDELQGSLDDLRAAQYRGAQQAAARAANAAAQAAAEDRVTPVRAVLESQSDTGAQVHTALAPPAAGPRGSQAVRVRSRVIDRLVNQAGEIMISRTRLDESVTQIKSSLQELTGNLERLRGQLREMEVQTESQMQSRLVSHKDHHPQFDPLEFDRFTRVQELSRMMSESVNDVATVQRQIERSLNATEGDLVAQARLTRELQRDLLRTRMVEFSGVSERLYRVVRQAAKDTGRQVRLDISGGQIEVDRGVLDRMTPAFEHLLRNAVAHGIEDAPAREAAGKDPVGTIHIHLRQDGNDVHVEFRDDGGGLDVGRIAEKAKRLALVPQNHSVTEAEATRLVLLPGFSTADHVTEISGRGIGMDVVRSEVNALGGRIDVATQAGMGARFTLQLPMTTAVTQIVMFRCAAFTFGVPANVVEMIRRAHPEELQAAYHQGVYLFGGENVPVYWAGSLLNVSAQSDEAVAKSLPIVIFRSAAQRVALQVDEVAGNQEVVVKNLGPQLSRLPGLVGMTTLANGAVVPIYNPVALASIYGARARELGVPKVLTQADLAEARKQAAGQNAADVEPTILVVDDSITVRRVTQRLLHREGFRVKLAADGVQALESLREDKPALMLSDIEMPKMDGFDLVRAVRASEDLHDLPVVIITSRMAQKHRQLAAELGVDHYLGKPYSEDELLRVVHHYVRSPDGATPRYTGNLGRGGRALKVSGVVDGGEGVDEGPMSTFIDPTTLPGALNGEASLATTGAHGAGPGPGPGPEGSLFGHLV